MTLARRANDKCRNTRCVYGWMTNGQSVTEDMSLSAHYENTILITKGKPEILSLTEDEKAAGFLELL